MGLGLQNFSHMLHTNQRNVDRFQAKLAAGRGGQSGQVVEPEKSDDPMRIDSDDIHNHYHQAKEGMSSLAKVAAIGLAASGVGLPASIAAWNLPAIVDLFSQGSPAATAPDKPAVDLNDSSPTIDINGHEYELSLEP